MPAIARLKPFLFYALSVALGKGLAILTLPVVAHRLPPQDFVRLDMAASVIEPLGLIAAFALSEALFRFGQGEREEKARILAPLLGFGLMASAVLILVTQGLLVPVITDLPNMPGALAMRAILLTTCLGAFIELPLAYARLADQPGRFLVFVALRSVGQAALLIGLLSLGHGVDAVLIGNAALDLAIILGLVMTLPKGACPRLDRAESLRTFRYAAPILIGGLAMFILGSCDRWFLAGRVAPEHLAHYALAAKLALALALASQPFALWWYPRRLGVLAEPDGAERSARFWLMGVAVLAAGAVGVMLVARLLVLHLLPASYHGALAYLPALLAIVALNELASLSNVAAYARAHGFSVLRTNLGGALVALACYALLIPPLGLSGAIIATLAGQGLRLALFLGERHGTSALPYAIGPAAGLLLPAFMAVHALSQPVLALTILPALLALGLGMVLLARNLRKHLPAFAS